MQVILDSSFARLGSAPIWGGKKGEFRDWANYPPISDLIHLARCVEFNPQFNPWIVLIELRGTEFNRRINLLSGLGRFNLGLALIGFRTTGAWSIAHSA